MSDYIELKELPNEIRRTKVKKFISSKKESIGRFGSTVGKGFGVMGKGLGTFQKGLSSPATKRRVNKAGQISNMVLGNLAGRKRKKKDDYDFMRIKF